MADEPKVESQEKQKDFKIQTKISLRETQQGVGEES